MQIPFVGFQPVQSSEHMLVKFKLNKNFIFNHDFYLGIWYIWFMPNIFIC
jgi:hypothetical protein